MITREQIEILGFKFSSKSILDWYVIDEVCWNAWGHKFSKMYLLHGSREDNNKDLVKIYGLEYGESSDDEPQFIGKCKDISELTAVVDLIGIKR